MTWHKEINGKNSLDVLIIFGAIFLIINFYQSSYLLMFLGAFLIILSLMSRYYLNHIADHLTIENDRLPIHVTVGDQFTIPVKIKQNNWLPIINATVRIKLNPILEGEKFKTISNDSNLELIIPIQLKGNETVQLSLPLLATKRGVTRIKELELTISNFFGLGYVHLTYKPLLQKEIIVYPSLIPVPQIDQIMSTNSYGNFVTPSSIFEDFLAPIGTRDYVYSDSFHRIHWKASAKTQVLQTKIYERTADYSFTFIINLRNPNHENFRLSIVENIESIASNIAYMVQYATLKNIQYEIFLNLNMESGVPVYHLPIGGGKSQLSKTFEILARINGARTTQPIDRLLHYVEKQQRKSPVVILCGPFGKHGDRYFAQMRKRGQNIYYLQDDLESPKLVPFGQN
ncbi:DUF58 domain-containing protein [Bacillus sp. AFS017336]|uniref:DUF58 domain-containing protein n=1 Tax=Bacillus sp. AFS017336 TaxID=2033489 RepID=UPI000BEF4A4E|nr:DUF58 domain-containing protein [Bacillus sp. AFS017336]PEL10501.1 hypothetical protein CN601_12135 [Bacillus sp. AFS017336]